VSTFSTNILNNTVYNYTTNVSDGLNQPYYWVCVDNATNSNTTDTRYINVDVTAPAYTINYPFAGSGFNSSSTSIDFNITVTDATIGTVYNNTCNLTVYMIVNISNINAPNGVKINGTPVTAFVNGNMFNYSWKCWDYYNNSFTTSTWNGTIDTSAPALSSYISRNYSSGTDFLGNVTFVALDGNTTISSCGVNIYYPNGSTSVVSGTMNATSKNVNCTATVTSAKYLMDGRYVLEPFAYDSASPTPNYVAGVNQSNWTFIKLYTGWNLIQADRNGTLAGLSGNWSSQIIRASWYNNSAHTYLSWVQGTSTNAAAAVTDGDALYVYANTTIYLVRVWNKDVVFKNFTLTVGWNQISLYNTTNINMSYICTFYTVKNATGAVFNFTHLSYYDASTALYTSFRCGLTKNAATIIPRGAALWAAVNDTYYCEVYRQ
jgi:hypothetical protein